MASNDLAFTPISELSQLIEQKKVSPVEVAELMLQRIDQYDSQLLAFHTVFRDEVLATARAAEAEIQHGYHRGPLHGIPLGIKANYESGPTCCGSGALADYVAPADCTVVAKLKQAGALILGKTSMYEFGMVVSTTKAHFPVTRNPWNLERESGGSSGGTAASTVAGMAYGGTGHDTGGSIRWPAQCCGIVGFKPTYGRVSRAGVFPTSWSLDHMGPLARTITDSALILQAIAGYDPKDLGSANEPVPDFTAQLGKGIRGARIGLLRSLYEDNCEPSMLQAFNDAVKVFESLGAEIVDVPTITLRQLSGIQWPNLNVDSTQIHLENMRNRSDDYLPHTKLHVAYGLLVDGMHYVNALRARAQVRNDLIRTLTNDVDVLMTPTTGFAAPVATVEPPGVHILTGEFPLYTHLYNSTGLPAIQVPCGFEKDGLPVGLQIAGKPFDESTVLQFAHAYERETDWHQRRPPLFA